MANPQPDQFTKISNELMEVIPTFKFNGTQFRILFVVLRYTYGFQRKSHELSLTFLSNSTGIHKQPVKRAVDELIEKNVLTEISAPSFNKGRIIQLNKDYDSWQISRQSPKEVTVTQREYHTVTGKGYSTVTLLGYQERKYKENIKEIDNNNHKEKLSTVSIIEKEFGRALSPIELEQVTKWETEHPEEIVAEALKIMVLQGVYNLRYMDRILLNWDKNNLRTLKQIREHEEKRRKGTANSGKRNNLGGKIDDELEKIDWSRWGC